MSAEVLNFPKKVESPEVIKALIGAGMRQPEDIMLIGKGDLAFDIDGHDFYLKRNPAGGFRFYVHGESQPRLQINADLVDLQPVIEEITLVLAEV